MGACKACGEVFGVLELTNGLCEKCIADGYIIEKEEKKESISQKQSNSKLMLCKTCKKEISKMAKQCPYCGEEYGQNKDDKEINRLSKEYAKSGSKSRFMSFILTGLLGNIGLFYASFKTGFFLLLINALIGFTILSNIRETGNVSPMVILLFAGTWYILPILWGDRIIAKQKKKLLTEAKLMALK